MAKVNNDLYLKRYDEYHYQNIKIDDKLTRTVFIHDTKNNLGHDIVYFSKIKTLILEGECFASVTPDTIP